MRILVIGSGGREHALVWALKRFDSARELYTTSVNAGILRLASPIDADPTDLNAIAEFATRKRIDLTLIGPEQPLVDGLADILQSKGLAVFGPCSAAAALEGSKIFAKQFMARNRVPTARFEIAESPQDALAIIASSSLGYPLVIKADGLAAGKGVILAVDEGEAKEAVESLMIAQTLGSAGRRLVLEECLSGRELSYLVLSDGNSYSPLAVAQDHKRAFDSDRGPNTGGMGAFSVNGLLSPDLEKRIQRELVEPTLEGAEREGLSFRGVLYCGLMLTEEGPKALEYNVRFGDPETQAIVRRLDSDLAESCLAVARGNLASHKQVWSDEATTCVVVASAGYPGTYETGKSIDGLDRAESVEGVVVFHAGTKRSEDGRTLTAGGRVLGVSARAGSLEEASARAYEAIGKITFPGMHFRRDIGRAGL